MRIPQRPPILKELIAGEGDLLDLEAKGLLQKSKRGKAMVFTAHPDLRSKIGENPKR